MKMGYLYRVLPTELIILSIILTGCFNSTSKEFEQPKQISEIFEIESKALGYSDGDTAQIRAKYEDEVQSMTTTLKNEGYSVNTSELFGLFKKDTVDDGYWEPQFFLELTRALYSNLHASHKENELVMTSILENSFNCYSSSVILADVCARLGKKVNVVLVPGHVFLMGNQYWIETTTNGIGDWSDYLSRLRKQDPDSDYDSLPVTVAMADCVLSINNLDSKYPAHQVGDLDLLVAASYNWAGTIYLEKKDLRNALESYKDSIEIDPDDPAPYYGLAVALEDVAGVYAGLRDLPNAYAFLEQAQGFLTRAKELESSQPK